MNVIADLQLHSKYSRAVSPQMVIDHIADWARRKGIGLVATGDWTHPQWLREIQSSLEEAGNGLLKIKNRESGTAEKKRDAPYFLLATEVSCIYSQGGKARRIHTLIWSPSIATAQKINRKLTALGANLLSDGRPILGLTSIELAELVFSVDPTCLIIPAHAWTPWFSLYGSQSGFDSIDECFGEFSDRIYAIETGLSSDPAMNWRIEELDQRSILSFSDAHSGARLGREATVFSLEQLSYAAIRESIMAGGGQMTTSQLTSRIAYTIEFYPEEGKYHYTGHRACGVRQTPQETKENGVVCPVCGRNLTVGVMHRVEDLAGRREESLRLIQNPIPGTVVTGTYSQTFPQRPPYIKIVPLVEILAAVMGHSTTSKKVQAAYARLTDKRSEFSLLLNVSLAELTRYGGEAVAQGIDLVRRGDLQIDPGYDGVFGLVSPLFS